MFLNRTIFCLISMFWVTAQAQEIFSDIQFHEAVKEAATLNKHIYVFGITSWCDQCVEMNTETYTDTTIQTTLHKNFISLKIDLESDMGLNIAMKYRANPAPQHLFFDTKGYLVKRGQGNYDPTKFLDLINTATDSIPDLAPLPYPLDFTLDYPEWYRDFRKAPSQRTIPSHEKIRAFLDSRDSITDEVTWAILYSLPTPEKYAEKIAANKYILSQRFGKDEVLEKLSSFVYTDVKQAIKDQSESALYSAMRKADKILGSDAGIYKIRYQLYYYQYNSNWLAYAEIGAELGRNAKLRNGDWLNEIATKIYRNTQDYGALKLSLEWMYPLIESEENYNYLLTTAQLEYALGNKEKTLSLVRKALAAADGTQDTSDADRLMEVLQKD